MEQYNSNKMIKIVSEHDVGCDRVDTTLSCGQLNMLATLVPIGNYGSPNNIRIVYVYSLKLQITKPMCKSMKTLI